MGAGGRSCPTRHSSRPQEGLWTPASDRLRAGRSLAHATIPRTHSSRKYSHCVRGKEWPVFPCGKHWFGIVTINCGSAADSTTPPPAMGTSTQPVTGSSDRRFGVTFPSVPGRQPESQMSFLSTAFVVFFSVVLLGLRLAPSRDIRRWLLLTASGVLYATWKPAYLLVLAAPIVIDYFCAIRIEESGDPEVRRRWVVVGVGSNILVLAFFKYANFFLWNVAAIARIVPWHLAIILPLGISFFTFKAISYIMEVHRGELKACRSFLGFATYVSYFPDLLAGPIVRASIFLPQMKRSLCPTWPRIAVGSQMILLGLTKKLLIARSEEHTS